MGYLKVFLFVGVLTSFYSYGFAFEGNADEVLNENPADLAQELGISDLRFQNAIYGLQMIPFEQSQIQNNVNYLDYYSLILVINKAASGPEAQTMKVYQNGRLLHHWLVSTGRERQEDSTKSGRKYFSATPVGYYSPQRLIRKHWSITWEAWMEYSIFFNGGVAVHATTPEHYANLGHRDSGGCVRLHPKNAKILWELQEQAGRGSVPVVDRYGRVQKDIYGNLILKEGYKTLIVVEDR